MLVQPVAGGFDGQMLDAIGLRGADMIDLIRLVDCDATLAHRWQ